MTKNTTSDNILKWIVLAGELVVVNVALGLIDYYYMNTGHGVPPHYKRLMFLMSLVYAICGLSNRYNILSRFVRFDQLARGLMSTLFSFTALSLLVLWVFRWPLLTPQFMLPFYAGIWVFVTIYRWTLRRIIKRYRSKGHNSMRVVFVGDVHICKSLYDFLRVPYTGYQLQGYYAEEPYSGFAEADYLGKPGDVPQLIDEGKLDLHELYCCLPSSENPLINKILNSCEHNLIRYNHIPPSFNYQRHNMAFEQQEGVPVLHLHNEPLSYVGNRIVKRAFDLICSSLFLVTVFPIVLLIFGTAVKLSSPGPIFFRQRRNGLNGKEFWCLKFRSMKVNADSDKLQATKDDPRKTKVGEFMRKTSIDELPQFINVWLGDMSIVGPRPHMVSHTVQYSELIGNYMVRHFAKPGITGWAQINGCRGETKTVEEMENRVKCDIWYIEHWTPMLDIEIFFKTFWGMIRSNDKQAY